MSKELTKEQLLEYVKKQKLKIKKLETDLAAATLKNECTTSEASENGEQSESGDNAAVAALTEQLQNKERAYEQLLGRITTLESASQKTKSELDQKITDLVAENTELKHSLQVLETEASASKQNHFEQSASDHNTIQLLSDERDRVSKSLEDVQMERDLLRTHCESYKAEYEKLKTTNEELQKQLSSREQQSGDLLDMRSAMAAQQERLASVESALTTSEQALSQQQNEMNALKSRLAEEQANEIALQTELDQFKINVSAKETKIEQLRVELENMASVSATKSNEEVQTLTERIAVLKGQLNSLQEALTSEQSASAAAESFKVSLEKQLDVLRAERAEEVARLQAELQNMVSTAAHDHKDFAVAKESESESESETKLQVLTDRIAVLEEQLNSLQEALTNEQSEKVSLTQQLDVLRAERAEEVSLLRSELAAVKESNSATVIPVHETEVTVDKATNENEEHLARIKSLQEQIETMSETLCHAEHASTECQSLHKQTTTELEATIESLRQEIEGLRDSLSTKTGDLQSLHAEHADLLQRIEDVQGSKGKLEEVLTTLQREHSVLQQRLEQATDTGRDHAVELQQKLTDMQNQWEAHEAHVKTQIADYEAQLVEKDQSLHDLRTQLLSLQAQQQEYQKLQGDAQTWEQEKEDLLRQLAEKDEQVDHVKSQLQHLEANNTVSSAETSQRVVQLQEEVDAVRKDLQLKEDTTKKALCRLKLKMKEVEELNQQLETYRNEKAELLTNYTALEKEKMQLTAQVDFLRGEMTRSSSQVQGSMADQEQRLKALNEALLASEERLSAILLEKNKLRDEQAEKDRSINELKDQIIALTNAKDHQVKRVKELEAKEHAQAMKVNEVTMQYEQLKAANASLTQEISTLRGAQASFQAADTQLRATGELTAKQSQTIAELQEKLSTEQRDFAAKEEAFNDRVKKLKALLAKVNQVSQEKDSRLQQLEIKRPKRFLVLAKVTVKVQSSNGPGSKDEGSVEETWSLVLPDVPPSDSDASPAARRHRWIEDSAVQEWVSQGSSIIGAVPQDIDRQWQDRYQHMQDTLQRERDDWKSQFDDLSQQFSTYKVRAQTALKRIGTEDQEKQRQKEQELRELDELRQALQRAQEVEAKYRNQLEEAKDQLHALEDVVDAKTQELKELKGELVSLQKAAASFEEERVALQKTVDARELQCKQHESDIHRLQHKLDKALQDLQEQQQVVATLRSMSLAVAEPVAADDGADRQAVILSKKSPERPPFLSVDTAASATSASSSVPATGEQQSANNQRHFAQNAVSPSYSTSHPPTPQSTRSNSHQQQQFHYQPASNNNRLLVHQQADHLLRESVQLLREENSNLNLEVGELRNEVSLRDEQIAMLKSAVRELEASLLREQEFNAENRRLNADYLVNVLRKFLMAVDASERAKLVGVLCQLLHLQPEETKMIAERWAVRGGGLVGWLLPPRPPATPTTGNRGAGGDALSQDGKVGANNGHAGVDAAYDPYGVNINPY